MTNKNQEMFKIEIELPKAWEVTSRGKDAKLDVEALSAEIIAKAVTHGLTQKISDSAASAANSAALAALGNDDFKVKAKVKAWTSDDANWPTIQAEALRMMEAVVERLHDGDWGVERTGGASAVDPVTKKTREIARPMYKATLAPDAVRAFNGFNAKGQYDAIDSYVETAKEQGVDLRAMAEAMVDAVKNITVDVTAL